MFWQKIGYSVSDRLFHNSVIAENQCLYTSASSAVSEIAYSQDAWLLDQHLRSSACDTAVYWNTCSLRRHLQFTETPAVYGDTCSLRRHQCWQTICVIPRWSRYMVPPTSTDYVSSLSIVSFFFIHIDLFILCQLTSGHTLLYNRGDGSHTNQKDLWNLVLWLKI